MGRTQPVADAARLERPANDLVERDAPDNPSRLVEDDVGKSAPLVVPHESCTDHGGLSVDGEVVLVPVWLERCEEVAVDPLQLPQRRHVVEGDQAGGAPGIVHGASIAGGRSRSASPPVTWRPR